jgi:hypothetical protein
MSGEALEDRADGAGDSLVRMKEDFAILFPQMKPTGNPRRSSPRAALLRIPPSSRANDV